MENTLLSVRDLSVQYHTQAQNVAAVDRLSLSIGKGEVVGLVGETGAGKTTLALSIMGLLPSPVGRITGGSIVFDGKELKGMKRRELEKIRGRDISMIFQDPMTSLNPVETVGEQITEVIRIHNKQAIKLEAMEQAREMLTMVGLPGDRFFNYPHEFSGGMKQRIVIAIALACDPKLLIADEPTTALDVTIQAQVLELIKSLQKKTGSAVLLITHDMGVVAQMCSRVAVMYAGEIIESGSIEQIFRYRAHPYTRGLFDALPSLTEGKGRLRPIPGSMPDPAALPPGCVFAQRCPFARAECIRERPALREATPGHFIRCTQGANEGGQNG